MNYSLHQLRTFVEVVRTGSITRAAENLHLTQPAVSLQLKGLQGQFDIPLTEAHGRSLRITPFGEEIARGASRILDEVAALEQRSLAHRGLLTGTLRIAVVSTGKYVMPWFLSAFMEEHPGLELVMDVTNKAAVIASLRDQQADLALVSILPKDLAVEELELMPNRLHLVVGRRLKGIPTRCTRKDLSRSPMILREPGSGTRWTMDRFLSAGGAPIRKRLELTSNEAVKQAVLAGLGWSIMPVIGIRQELEQGELRIVPMKGLPIRTSWRLIRRAGKPLPPAASAFLAHLTAEKDRLVKEHFAWSDEVGRT